MGIRWPQKTNLPRTSTSVGVRTMSPEVDPVHLFPSNVDNGYLTARPAQKRDMPIDTPYRPFQQPGAAKTTGAPLSKRQTFGPGLRD